MPVSHDLQTIVSRIGEAMAAGRNYTARVELPQLQRELLLIIDDAQAEERRAVTDRMTFDELCDGVDKKVLDQRALVKRARARHSASIATEQRSAAA